MIKNLLSTRLALLEFIIIGAIFWYQKFLVFGHESHKCQSCHGLVLCNIFSCLGSCLVSCLFLPCVLSCFVLFLRCVLLSWLVFNLVPRSLITKAKAGSGRVRKFIFFHWVNCERMTRMLSPARAMASAQKVILCKVFSSVQKRIFTEKVVFRLNINCKPFYLILKDFSKLSLYINKDFWNVVTKTWNDLKPPKTIYNHLQPPQKIQQPPTTIHNHLKNIYNHSQTI